MIPSQEAVITIDPRRVLPGWRFQLGDHVASGHGVIERLSTGGAL